MPWEAWFAICLTVVALVVMARNLLPPDATLLGVATLIAGGSMLSEYLHAPAAADAAAGAAAKAVTLLPSAADVAKGFGSPILWSVAAIFVVAAGLVETGAASRLAEPILGKGNSGGADAAGKTKSPLARAVAPLVAVAPFLSNTTVMAILLPVVTDWCRRRNYSPGKLLMPLNHIKMLGAKCCLLGTTTNLVVVAMMEKTPHPGFHKLGLFEIAWVGIPCMVAGVGFILLFGTRLLPDRKPAVSEEGGIRQYTVSVSVEKGGALDGKSVGDAGLRALPGLFLVEIERGSELIAAVGPSVVLQGDDRLTFAGALESVVDLRKMRGLSSEDHQHEKLAAPAHERVLIEAVISPECPLIGQSVRESRFRTHYGAAIIAIARGSERLSGKIGNVELKAGDTLLLEARPAFLERVKGSRDFFLASKVEGFSAPKHHKAYLAMAIMALLVVTTTVFHDAPLLLITMLAAGAMVATGCLSLAGARQSVEWRVILAIGASFALGEALSKSGAAGGMAKALIGVLGANPHVGLCAVFILTVLTAEIITNNAAATLMFPLALAAADRLGVSPMPFVIVTMLGASCSFMTPFSYQTNLMIMGPGGYKFSDYVRFGLPLTLVVGTVAMTVVPLVWTF